MWIISSLIQKSAIVTTFQLLWSSFFEHLVSQLAGQKVLQMGSEQAQIIKGMRNTAFSIVMLILSWPEVYFPGFGWLPFEPTPSFANPMGSQPVAETTETVQPAIEQPNESENMAETISSERSEVIPSEETTLTPAYKIVLFSLGVCLSVLLFFLLLFRKSLRWTSYLIYLHFFASTNTIAYQKLLNPLETLVPRKPAESLQEYSLRIEQEFKLDLRFIRLTTQYEAEIYGRQADPVKFDKKTYLEITHIIRKMVYKKILTKGSRFKK